MAHRMAILSEISGHDVLEWDLEDVASTKAVKTEFDKMVSRGFLGYADGKPTVTFDPEAEEILVTPVVTGG